MTAPTPERGDVRSEPTAEGLTGAEREYVADLVLRECRHQGRTGRDWCCSECHDLRQRILADRLAAVQAERDRWKETASSARKWAVAELAKADARAESAEAERDDLRAALDRVKALADEWAGDPIGGDLWRSEAVDALRAAVEGGRA